MTNGWLSQSNIQVTNQNKLMYPSHSHPSLLIVYSLLIQLIQNYSAKWIIFMFILFLIVMKCVYNHLYVTYRLGYYKKFVMYNLNLKLICS